jgi:hypothetical protein
MMAKRLTWSLISGPVGLVEVHANCPDTHIKLKKKLSHEKKQE